MSFVGNKKTRSQTQHREKGRIPADKRHTVMPVYTYMPVYIFWGENAFSRSFSSVLNIIRAMTYLTSKGDPKWRM